MHHIENRIFHLIKNIPDLSLIIRIKRLVSFQFFSDDINPNVVFVEIDFFQWFRRVDLNEMIISVIGFWGRCWGGDFFLLSTQFVQLSLEPRGTGLQILELEFIMSSVFLDILKASREFLGLPFVLECFFLICVALKKLRMIILSYGRKKLISFLFFDDVSDYSFEIFEIIDFQRNETMFFDVFI